MEVEQALEKPVSQELRIEELKKMIDGAGVEAHAGPVVEDAGKRERE
jgi:hypothetical protein